MASEMDGEGNQNTTICIDTSLGTHLVMTVAVSDTVSDFKRKIALEHRQCFPTMGDIKVSCLKLEWEGKLYHMSDSMFVKSAFGTRSLSLLAYAPRLEQHGGTADNERAALGGTAVCHPKGGRHSQHLKNSDSSTHGKSSSSSGESASSVDSRRNGTADNERAALGGTAVCHPKGGRHSQHLKNSDSSTHGKSSSSSGESASSVDSRRNGSRAIKRMESGGKNTNSESKIQESKVECIIRKASFVSESQPNSKRFSFAVNQEVD